MIRAILLCIVAWGLSVGVRELYAAESEGEKRNAPVVAGQAWEARIEAALQKKVAVSFRETPLREFVSWLGETTGELCLLDHRSLEDVGVADDVPLNAEFQAISVRSTLNLVLRDLGLTWVLRDGALVITSQEDVESTLLVEVFDVGDLVRPIPPGKADGNADQLIDLITATVAPQSWDTVGGPGTIAAFRGGLVVSQTREVCAQIRDLLAQYREAKRIAEQHPATAPPVAMVGGAAIRPAEASIQAVLDREAPFEFEGTALKDVAAYIQKTFTIPVVLDVKALDDICTDRSQPVTFRAARIQLRQALIHILRPAGLTWVIRDEALVITVREEAECRVLTAAYPVADLLGDTTECDELGDRQRSTGLDKLSDLIQSTVAPQTWSAVGGPGSIISCEHIDVLVVANDPDALAKVTDLLTKLRRHLAQHEQPTPAQADPLEAEATRLVVYFLPAPEPSIRPATSSGEKPAGGQQPSGQGGGFFSLPLGQMGCRGAFGSQAVIPETELMEIIRQLVEPKSWSARDDVYIKAIPGRLIVRQTERVHARIELLLRKLGVEYHRS